MASGKSQTAQVRKFAAADALHPLDLKCTLSVEQRQTPAEFSVLKQTFYQSTQARVLSFTSLLESLPSQKMAASPDHEQGHTAAGWERGLTYLGSLGAHWFPFVLPSHAASISGSGFFLAYPWTLLISCSP